jgi:ABC-type sugar transport system substrate-binding protein
LENVMRSTPAAIVIAPGRSAALQKAIDGAGRKVKIIGIDSAADPNAFISTLRTDNVAVGRLAADALATAIQRTYADAEGDVAMITASSGVTALAQRAEGFKKELAPARKPHRRASAAAGGGFRAAPIQGRASRPFEATVSLSVHVRLLDIRWTRQRKSQLSC